MTYKQRNNPRKLEVIKNEEFLSPWVQAARKKNHSCLVPKMWLCISVAVAPKYWLGGLVSNPAEAWIFFKLLSATSLILQLTRWGSFVYFYARFIYSFHLSSVLSVKFRILPMINNLLYEMYYFQFSGAEKDFAGRILIQWINF